MMQTIFREYDIRGKVGSEFIIDDVYDLTRAIAAYFIEKKNNVRTVAVGMDGRTHSAAIKEQVCAALADSGLDVIFIGVCPSPVLYFALYTLPVDAGLMITASHNPQEYNGLKLCLGTTSVWGLQVKEIWELFVQRKKIESSHKGSYTQHDVITEYVAWLAEHFKHLKNMQLSVVVDCANGAAGAVMPHLVQAMGWSDVHLLYPEIDGTYPNHEADPVKEKNMQDVKKILLESDVELGIGLDGDADRMVPMTKNGYLVPGDKLLALFAHPIIQQRPGAAVVMDVKSSSGLLELLDQWGAQACLSPSGHAIIKDQIKLHGAVLGGELSCHFFFNDRYFGYDDGIYAMLRLFELLTESASSLDVLLEQFPKKYSSPEFQLACAEERKRAIVEMVRTECMKRTDDVSLITIDGVRMSTDYGWGILRASNTQPMLSLRFESDSQQGLYQIKQDFFVALAPHVDAVILKELIGL